MRYTPVANTSYLFAILTTTGYPGNYPTKTMYSIDGQTVNNIYKASFNYQFPFYSASYQNIAWSDNTSGSQLKFLASSDTAIDETTEFPSAVVGTTRATLTVSDFGWIATMTVVGTETATINSLYMVKGIMYDSSHSMNTIVGALKLDTPVELNAENNYTANFTFAIEF